MSESHDPYAALRVPGYRWFIAGWLPASMGLQMQGTALGWEVYRRTQDPLALGLIGLARVLPVVVLALPAGQIIDRVNRQRALTLTQYAFAFTSGLLALASVLWARGDLGTVAMGLGVIYTLVALTGCARVFNGPGRSSLLPRIIPGGAGSATFQNAITWNSAVFHLAATAGPLLAGGVIEWTGSAWPVYALCAAGAAWFGFTIRRIPLEADPRDAGPPSRLWDTIRPSALMPGMLEGVRHMWREKVVLGAITLDLFAVLLGGATALLPVFASDILHVGPVGLGALRAAPYVGALVMAFVLAHRRPIRRAGPALLWSVLGFGLCTIGFGLSESFWLSIGLLFTLGAVDNISVVIRHTLVTRRTPDHLRGRVAAVNGVFIECSNELGGFESGLVARLFSPWISVVSGGVGTVLVVAAMALAFPQLRRLGTLHARDLEEEEATFRGEPPEADDDPPKKSPPR